jgi:hypothetical protein
MSDQGLRGSTGKTERAFAALCLLVLLGWSALFALRGESAMRESLPGALFGGVVWVACALWVAIDLGRRLLGRPSRRVAGMGWAQCVMLNGIAIPIFNWNGSHGWSGVLIALGAMMPALAWMEAERRQRRAAKPRVAADRAAPGR